MKPAKALLPHLAAGVILTLTCQAQGPFLQVQPGHYLRVHTASSDRLEGRALAVSPESLVLVSGVEGQAAYPQFRRALEALRRPEEGAAYLSTYLSSVELDTLSQGQVEAVWRRGGAAKTGAIVGAIVAGVATFAGTALVCGAGEEGCERWGAVTLVSLAGAGGGALLGAGIGTAFPKWRLLYSRDRLGLELRPVLHDRAGVYARVTF